MLNFSNRKKKYYDLVLHDGTKLSLPMPTMRVFDKLVEIHKNNDDLDINDVKKLLEEILSSNRQGKNITAKHIGAFGFDDIFALIVGYMEFIQGALSDPNLKSLTIPMGAKMGR